MSSTLSSQAVTAKIATGSTQIIPCYGIHPWWSHEITVDSNLTKAEHYISVFRCDHATILPYLNGLPTPTPLAIVISNIEAHLTDPRSFVGEIGLDKSFRLPFPSVEGDSISVKPRLCSCHGDTALSVPVAYEGATKPVVLKTSMVHQRLISIAQIRLAVKHRKNVSCHSVQAAADLLELLAEIKKEDPFAWRQINVCVHSFGGNDQSARQLQRGELSN